MENSADQPQFVLQPYEAKEPVVLSKALAVPCKEESEELFKFVNGLKSNELVDAGLRAKARYELKDAELAVTY